MWYGASMVSNLAVLFTNRCNLHCEYCYLYSKQDMPQDEISTEELIETVGKTLETIPQYQYSRILGRRMLVFSTTYC